MHDAAAPAQASRFSSRDDPTGLEPERLSLLALPPVLTTGLYFSLPSELQHALPILFLPQALGYLGLAIWTSGNTRVLERLGLNLHLLGRGLRVGLLTGLTLGFLNVWVILWLVPRLGGDIQFLRETPHAQVPVALMLPWLILLIAIAIELNFRGFLLGRLLALCQRTWLSQYPRVGPVIAVCVAATVFAFDPFMVITFKHLHWIAVWDGLVWGTIWLYLRNLYATIAAHAVEVMVLYSCLTLALGEN